MQDKIVKQYCDYLSISYVLQEPKSNANIEMNAQDTLERLKEDVENFQYCDLKQIAKNTVFADGSANADLMLVGEAPGANEDEQGIPFCGQSGKLLDNMFAAIGRQRERNMYITNTVFWRPPGNRNPTEEEVKACLPFLHRHIAIIDPKLIVAVGSVAAKTLLGINISISSAKQNLHKYKSDILKKDIPVKIIFHPAYLLRQSKKKKESWMDMLEIKNLL